MYCDEELLGSIPESELKKIDIFITESGDEYPDLDDSQLAHIRDFVYKYAQKKLLMYLAKMERSTFDCRQYLKRLDVPYSVATEIIEMATEKKWLCDHRCAEIYATEGLFCRYSPQAVKAKLIEKKIPSHIINEALESKYDRETMQDIIESTIDRLLGLYSDTPMRKKFEKIATALYRKGFAYDDYESILRLKIESHKKG